MMSPSTKKRGVDAMEIDFADTQGVRVSFNHDLYSSPRISEWVMTYEDLQEIEGLNKSTVALVSSALSCVGELDRLPTPSSLQYIRLRHDDTYRNTIEIKASTFRGAKHILNRMLEDNGYEKPRGYRRAEGRPMPIDFAVGEQGARAETL